jgi:DNA-binding transcriptional LysR family regulator
MRRQKSPFTNNPMELRQLRYTVAVADRRSFTKAAASEIVVQSALSQQVRKLEQELGVRLFERTTRSVSITAAGEALLPLIRLVLAGADQLTAEAQSIRGVLHGRITIGLMEVPPEVLDIAEMIDSFHRRHPGIDVVVRSGGGNQLVQAVRDREVDVALVGFEVTRVVLMTEFVRRGLGIAVLPESVARVQALSGGLVLARISDAQLRRQARLVFRESPSPAGRAPICPTAPHGSRSPSGAAASPSDCPCRLANCRPGTTIHSLSARGRVRSRMFR